MRKLLILLLIIPFVGKAQMDTATFEYSKIDTLKGSSSELFVRVRKWAFGVLSDPKYSIQILDSAHGHILINMALHLLAKRTPIIIKFVNEIDIKDNRTRFKCYDYTVARSDGRGGSDYLTSRKPVNVPYVKKVAATIMDDVRESMIYYTNSIHETYLKEISKTDNW